ncbi:oxidoreductase [Kineobactrum sediminis]|uniref:Oxidoreductase n=1 Tax=Kineobactrum sediminis TaxID=1905677 RepID=A0A2N5XXX7_9GAMM|nr:ferric reductase-like transmembrane domain-containing protein [Kineobactrum sediminis]PLW80952.1 oxidoreductase [Kineobactrum sediminis]
MPLSSTSRIAHGLVWSLALVPLIFFIAGLSAGDFASTATILNMLGRLTGVLGVAFLLLSAALSARVPGVDQPFGGLTKLWHTHHRMGAASLFLLMLHPLLLAFSAAGYSQQAAISTLFPAFSNTAAWMGWTALILMMIFLAPSFAFFGPPQYERWKHIHALAGPAVIFALIHTFMASRTMPGMADTVIWSIFALLAVGAVSWRLLFSQRIGRLDYTVKHVEPVTDGVVELTLEPQDKPLEYEAGNFVYLTPFDKHLDAGDREEHPYTLSSSPLEPNLRIAIKSLGDASRAIQSIDPGTKVTVEGPYGRFFPAGGRVESPELWVAGGIGITPFLARMRHIQALQSGGDIVMIYAVQDESRALYADEIRELALQIPGFVLVMHYFYHEGPVSAEFLHRHCPDLGHREIYICGPLPLNELIKQHAHHAGVTHNHIHSEEFELL